MKLPHELEMAVYDFVAAFKIERRLALTIESEDGIARLMDIVKTAYRSGGQRVAEIVIELATLADTLTDAERAQVRDRIEQEIAKA